MKYIVLSFDDGRKDFYTNALPILKKYRLCATLNIISDFVGLTDPSLFPSGNGECVSWEEIKLCEACGIEIAGHSANHTNSIPEILRGNDEISKNLGAEQPRGFASPRSQIGKDNFDAYRELLLSERITYIRSGNRLKRDGYLNLLLYFCYKYTKSAAAFSLYNRNNIIPLTEHSGENFLFPSVTCNLDNTADQMVKFIQKMPDNTASILMLHSILTPNDPGFQKDKWFNTTEDFERLCSFLSAEENISVITNTQLYDMLRKSKAPQKAEKAPQLVGSN